MLQKTNTAMNDSYNTHVLLLVPVQVTEASTISPRINSPTHQLT